MKQIKTISQRRDCSEKFDADVNAAIAEGWQLVDRFLAPAAETSSLNWHPAWVAYLEREVAE